MDFSKVADFAEDHPVATFGIVIVGGIALLWLLGFFGSSGASTASGTNLDQAYYASIAAQNESANALSIAQVQANMYSGIAQTQANAAVAENAANNAALVTGGQQQVAIAQTQSAVQQNIADTAVWGQVTGGQQQVAIAQSADQANMFGAVLPVYEQYLAKGYNPYSSFATPGGTLNVNQNALTIPGSNTLAFSPPGTYV